MSQATAHTANSRRDESKNIETSQHRDDARENTISLLAKESDADIEHVRELYDSAHQRIDAQATIKTYVPVIAARLVRVALQRVSSATLQ